MMRVIALVVFYIFLSIYTPITAFAVDIERTQVTIWSQGTKLAGDLYKPKNLNKKVPGILLVHGWGGTKDHLRTSYARQFAELGFVVLAFDYKGWGESNGPFLVTKTLPATEGETTVKGTHIRNVIDPISMLADVRAALNYLAGESQVNSDRIGIWGTSLGGGLSLQTVIRDKRIKAYVTQVGFVNFQELRQITELQVRQLEIARARGQLKPFPGKESSVPNLRGYPNWVAFKRLNPFAELNKVKIPTLVIDAENEELFNRNDHGNALYKSLKGKVPTTYMTVPGAHYAVYRGEGYRLALKAAQDWFVKHLMGK